MARGYSPRTIRLSIPRDSSESDVVQKIKNLAKWTCVLIAVGGVATASVFAWPYIRFGTASVLLGSAGLVLVLWHRPGWTLRYVNVGLGYVLLAAALVIALSLRRHGWGGSLGDMVASWPLMAGYVLAALAVFTGVFVAFPAAVLGISRAVITWAIWTARVIYATMLWVHRGTAAAAAWYQRVAPHRRLLLAFFALVRQRRPATSAEASAQAAAPDALPTPPDPEGIAAGGPSETGEPHPQKAKNGKGLSETSSKTLFRPSAKGGGGLGGWKLPALNLLHEEPKSWVSEEENLEKARLIEQTLADYGIEVEVQEIRPGPVVTQFGVVPGWTRKVREVKDRDKDGRPKLDRAGKPMTVQVEEKLRVRVDTILSREKDLAMALAAKSLRFEAPVPGESFVGLEVPNLDPSPVMLRGVLESDAYKALLKKGRLPIALGKGSGGEAVVTDLCDMPHLLIAGSTGSGKSVCMNSIIGSLLMQLSPYHLRFIMTDPKRVELTPYNGIPHLAIPVVVEPDQAVPVLRALIREMQERYKRLEAAGVRNIQGFNDKVASLPERIPYLVLVIDELADLMMASSVDVEHSLCRLAQLGRAVGIHLVVATQRPSVDVITGLIKANFPTRVSFAVTSQVDSRTILDSSGAEKLLGRGDMLFSPIGAPKPKRVQGAYVSDEEIALIVSAWKAQEGTPVPPFSLVLEEGAEQADELFDRAKELAEEHHSVSASLLQRKLGIGYPRASRLMDRLVEEGMATPVGQGRPRQAAIPEVSEPGPKN